MLAQEPDADGSRGVLLAMSSALARHPSATHFGTHAYAASKGAIESFTRAVAATYAPRGIRANAICPGLIETGMTKPLLDDPSSGARKFVEETPTNTWGQPEEVAKLAAFLASGDAPFINGAHIAIDGGWTIK
jgi:NAD(P)-dependent dehydrogenase (short-subunit alcohol dehydrogenase family)